MDKISFVSFKKLNRYIEMMLILNDEWYRYEEFFDEIEERCVINENEHLYITKEGKIDTMII